MPISMPPYQLSMELDLPEEESSSGLSVEEIRIREELARQKFESGESWQKDNNGKPVPPRNFDMYIALRIGRYPFRVAALIMWLATPKQYRYPKTQDELAHLLGMSSDRQFSVWRAKNPAIDAMVQEAWKKDAIEHLPDSLDAMYQVAATPNYKGNRDRQLHAKLAGILTDRTEIDLGSSGDKDDVLNNIPFAQLLKFAGIDSPEKVADFKAKIEAERQAQLKAEQEKKDA